MIKIKLIIILMIHLKLNKINKNFNKLIYSFIILIKN